MQGRESFRNIFAEDHQPGGHLESTCSNYAIKQRFIRKYKTGWLRCILFFTFFSG